MVKALRVSAIAATFLAACNPTSELCARCEVGGCGAGLVCTPSATGAVCAPVDEGLSACHLVAADAGTAADAGVAEDAGLSGDAGTSAARCPDPGTSGLAWLESSPAGVCFTRTEVTVRQFEPCHTSSCAPEYSYSAYSGAVAVFCNLDKPGRQDHPMNCIDERGAAAFCASVGGRLPTREEWIAEASNLGTRAYPWGDEAVDCTRAVMNDGSPGCGSDDLFEPCSRPAGNSVSGLCDMSGNVWELTSEIQQGDEPVLCGGSLIISDDPDFLRADACYVEAGIHDDHGFRCVADFTR